MSLNLKYGEENPNIPSDHFYNLYINEVTISDNTTIFKMGDIKVANMIHNVINILTTTDPGFCDFTYKTMKNIINSSILVSVVSEKERSKFCQMMRKKVDKLVLKIEST